MCIPNLSACIHSQYFAYSSRQMLNGQYLLFCSFIRCNSQCAHIENQLLYDFAHSVKFVCFYTCKIVSKSGPVWFFVRGTERAIRSGMELCSSQLQTSTSEESSEHHQSAGKVRSNLLHWHELHHENTTHVFSLYLCVCVFVRSILCLVSLSLCSTPVKQRSLWGQCYRQLWTNTGMNTYRSFTTRHTYFTIW